MLQHGECQSADLDDVFVAITAWDAARQHVHRPDRLNLKDGNGNDDGGGGGVEGGGGGARGARGAGGGTTTTMIVLAHKRNHVYNSGDDDQSTENPVSTNFYHLDLCAFYGFLGSWL